MFPLGSRQRYALAAAIGLITAACADPLDPAPYASADCEGPRCREDVVPGRGPVGGPEDAGGGGGDGGVTLQGELGVFTDTLFLNLRPFTGTAAIGATGRSRMPALAISGSAYELPGIEPGVLTWLDLEPVEGDPDALPTLHVVDGTQTQVDLGFASRGVLDGVLADLTTPRAFSADLAYVVLTVVDGAGSIASGVTVTDPGGQAVAYDDGPLFSEGPGETQSRGMALLVGLPASSFPGAPIPVQVTSAVRAVTASLTVPVARGAVSFVRASLP